MTWYYLQKTPHIFIIFSFEKPYKKKFYDCMKIILYHFHNKKAQSAHPYFSQYSISYKGEKFLEAKKLKIFFILFLNNTTNYISHLSITPFSNLEIDVKENETGFRWNKKKPNICCFYFVQHSDPISRWYGWGKKIISVSFLIHNLFTVEIKRKLLKRR